jgi:hypothetical protein
VLGVALDSGVRVKAGDGGPVNRLDLNTIPQGLMSCLVPSHQRPVLATVCLCCRAQTKRPEEGAESGPGIRNSPLQVLRMQTRHTKLALIQHHT